MNALENEADLRTTTLGLLHKDRDFPLPHILLDRLPALAGVETPPLLLRAEIDPPDIERESVADAGRQRVLAEHTAAHRALSMETTLMEVKRRGVKMAALETAAE